ncbi:hypothetical protein Nepgr_026301 [Nepenthes gracilis]|uniref:Uncharacterized protein n=1 Tax=Nepenthes gracilis TaxID=150966 RepID=A0AAD3T7V0_NEPGR|nr:hypothetical protein Nepgr_026301 [Nepenthes gracilis]
MNSSTCVSSFSDSKGKSYLWSIFLAASLICGSYFIGSALVENGYKQRISKWQMQVIGTAQDPKSDACRNHCRPLGTESLPSGIIVKTSDLEMRPLWDFSVKLNKLKQSTSLLGMAVGIKQKYVVSKIVEKFLSCAFVVMLFHYDGIVDKWRDLEWSDRVIHLSAKNQTKWWFAKRFLHPDIVAEYDYVFLWDEDLEVETFNPQRYIDIVKQKGLEISQPALNPAKSVVHHQITVRQKKSTVHRRFYKSRGSGRCDDNSTAPPCIGWVEMMAPVFSKAAWRCVWYMIQVPSESQRVDNRSAVRRQSFIEMQKFSKRWKDAVKEDKCWIDMYEPVQQSSHQIRIES